MNITLIFAIITITLALIFYTIGVFSERKAGVLKPKHLYFFLIGLILDTTGTTLMSTLKSNSNQTSSALHQITGLSAIILMFIHLLWALYVLRKGSVQTKANFHKFSIVVWAFWLIPYLIGMFIGIRN